MAAVIAVSGVKNSGKTTLIEKLLPALNARGVKTAVLKHDGHSFAADREGTDTCRFLAAGAAAGTDAKNPINLAAERRRQAWKRSR